MKINISALLFTLWCFFAFATPHQEVQIGITHNTLMLKVSNNKGAQYLESKSKLFLQPCYRYTLHISLLKKADEPKISLSPFIGLHAFGGKGASDTNNYKDKIIFYACEAGFQTSFHFKNRVSFGLGMKSNFFTSVSHKYYGYVNQPDSMIRSWILMDDSKQYKVYSFNAGGNIKYYFNRFTITAEACIGLSNLNNEKGLPVTKKVTENNYRLLLGYTLGKKKNKK
jgi:hypothetical protein